LPGPIGLASQGSVHETVTQLLHGQKALFPPLANSNHPLKCIVAKLTTREHREELEHNNIKTIGNLSRLDKASVDRQRVLQSVVKGRGGEYDPPREIAARPTTNSKADGGASHGQEGKSVTNTRSRLTKSWKNNTPKLKDTQLQNR